MKTTTWIAVLVAMFFSATGSAAKGEREVITQGYDVGKSPRLSLSNLNGAARITGWDKATIEVEATKTTSGSRERLDEAEVKFDFKDDRLRIEVKYEDDDNWNDRDGSVEVDFDIRVPRNTRIESVELVNGELEIGNINGDVKVSSVNGDVSGTHLGGEVELSTVNGDVSLMSIPGHESIHLSSVNGSVSLALPRDVNAKLSANTVHGEVRGDLGRGVTHAGSSIDAVLGSGGTRIALDTVNGDIRIRRDGGKSAQKNDASADSDDDSE